MTTPAPELTLRAATINDSEALARTWYQGWRDGHLGHVPTFVLPHRRLVDFRRRMPGQIEHTTVATVGARLVGFVAVRDDEVEQLYVDAAARGGGAAAALLQFGERVIVTRYRRAWLAVVAGNTRARSFYERQGWHDSGAIDHPATTAEGNTIVVPARRYEKQLSPLEVSRS